MDDLHDMNSIKLSPTTIVIFGITGDLARRKLLPALWNLFRTGKLPQQFHVVGFARRHFDKHALRELITKSVGAIQEQDEEKYESFLRLFSYQQGFFDEPEQYRALRALLEDIEHGFSSPANRLLYLSVSPVHYEAVFEALYKSGITKNNKTSGNTRVLVEKPFGRDAKTARSLDEKLGGLFTENQIYRIDHYLAKETVQNIINFRFSNFLFIPVWNKDGIDKVHIELFEKIGMEGRGVFYSETGALRDVGQNHLLQLLAMVAMRNPEKLDAEHIRARRAEVLQKLRPLENIATESVRAVYDGFEEEAETSGDTNTETYFKLRAFLDDPTWDGVPFILESGKRMHERATRITIYFKNVKHSLCPIDGGKGCQNTLTFEIQPEEGITVCFWAKKRGFDYKIEPRHLKFSYKHNFSERTPEAYERVLYDAVRGDQTLFASTKEVHFAWRFITPILEAWKTQPVEKYAPGSKGPESRVNI
ncbi:Glucose-6-phosphate 1-dehydrogenase [hydrothermal vent metagenome]|uniref:Glucose-6-phosphate 1-dehydrogenase n=1 Tax=hydrothermal vent metagenome TaxID=652676 RepID=A0A3B0VNA3_9ZZZZ